MGKVTKLSADYSRGKRNAHCGPCFLDDSFYCEHYVGKPAPEIGKCKIVEGPIQPIMWCKHFERVDDAAS